MQSVQQIILHSQAAQHRVAQGDAAAGVDVAEGGAAFLGLHGNAGEHLLHIDLHKAHDEVPALGQQIHRQGDDDLLVGGIQVLDGDLRPRQGQMVKVVFLNIALHAAGGIDQPAVVYKSKLFQAEQRLHLGLVGLAMGLVHQVILCHQLQRRLHIGHPVLQILGHHLLSAARQLIQVEKADGADRRFRVIPGVAAHPYRPEHQDEQKNNAPYGGGQSDSLLSAGHGRYPPYNRHFMYEIS